MRTAITLVILMAAPIVAVSCAQTPSATSAHGPDIRQVMLESERKLDRRFPDGWDFVLAEFAYIGDVNCAGRKLRVVSVKATITNMLAPRGENWMAFFDQQGHYVAQWPSNFEAPPIWCEGSLIYFAGFDGDGENRGNAMDVSKGLNHFEYVNVESPWKSKVTTQPAAVQSSPRRLFCDAWKSLPL